MKEDYELYHHGILGMKWGVRKFIERQDKGKTHRDRLQNKYLEQGYSKEEASRRAANRIRTEKALAIAGGVTLAAAAAYYAHKKYTTDEVISKKTKFQKIMSLADGETPSGNMQYMSFKRGDNKKYEGNYAAELLAEKLRYGYDDRISKVTTKFDRDIKIASPKRARDTFKNLYKNDPEFRKSMHDLSYIIGTNDLSGTRKQKRAFKALEKLIDNNGKNFHGKAYDGFNSALADDGEVYDKIRDKYFKALKKQGVDAIVDRNDKVLSAYRTKKPVIMLGEIAAKHTIKDMSNGEIMLKGTKESLKTVAKKYVKYILAPSVAINTAKSAKAEYKKQMSERNAKKTTKH